MNAPAPPDLDLRLDRHARLHAVAQFVARGVVRLASEFNFRGVDEAGLDGAAILVSNRAGGLLRLVDGVSADIGDRAFDQAVIGEVECFQFHRHSLADADRSDVLVLNEGFDRQAALAAAQFP